MSDTGSSGDNKPQQQDEVNLVSPPPAATAAPPEVENKPVTPAKRTPSKRVSAVERAQRESEELVKTLGGSLDIEGGRKTRSSTRGTPSRSNVVATPPPTKKARATSGTPRRGRGRKIDTAIESDQKTTPEKISSEPEAEAEPLESKPEPAKDAEESNVVDEAPKTEEKIDEATPEANITSSVADEKQSPAKDEADEKPEPMEVDGVSKSENETPSEAMETNESAKEITESSTENNSHEEKSKESDKVVVATVVEEKKSSSVVEENASTVAVDEDKNSEVESKPVENSVGNNIEVNNTEEKATSLPTEEVCPTIPPPAATPVPVSASAGNDHKAESNDFCEPKIASPPITANNDGATPQYCN